MIITETSLPGVFIIDPERIEDDRGFFARVWCEHEFARKVEPFSIVQCNLSYNKRKGTLRGMHFQLPPHEECKLVRCTRGAAYDVVIDLRQESPAHRCWCAVDLTADNRRLLYIPKGCAHGFQTLQDDTELFYQMSDFHHPECAHGLRWDDPAVGIEWPLEITAISPKDLTFEWLHRGSAAPAP